MTAFGLTTRQRQLLDLVTAEIAAGRPAPSYEEMRTGLGIGSKAGVFRLVKCLVERGHLEKLSRKERSLTLPGTQPTPAPRPPKPVAVPVSEIDQLHAYAKRKRMAPHAIVSAALAEYMRRNP